MGEEWLWRLCAELEHAAREAGGLVHHAEQWEWGIEPRRVPGTRRRWELVDCDGTTWAAGSAREILADRERLIRQVEECAADIYE